MRVLDESYSRKVLCAQKLDTYVSNTIQCTNTKYVWIQLCIPKGQSKMDNPDKLATQATQDKDKQNKNKQHNMCWTSLYANKQK